MIIQKPANESAAVDNLIASTAVEGVSPEIMVEPIWPYYRDRGFAVLALAQDIDVVQNDRVSIDRGAILCRAYQLTVPFLYLARPATISDIRRDGVLGMRHPGAPEGVSKEKEQFAVSIKPWVCAVQPRGKQPKLSAVL